MEEFIKYIKKEKLGIIKENISFKALTTFKCGGNTRVVVAPNDIKDLQKILYYIKENHIKYYILGNGSNVLASEKDFDGVIIKLTNIDYIKKIKGKFIVGAGCNLIKFALETAKKGYTGLEFACGIPGTIGGAIYMNAGAYKTSVANTLVEASFLNEKQEIITLKKRDLDFAYRHSLLQDNKQLICIEATFLLKKGNIVAINNLIANRRERRLTSQPLAYPSAGSVFRNPYNLYAGKLIEECGLKGKQIGGAQISDMHANFIINKENASSHDIKRLMDLAQKSVKENFNIDLKREQELLNWE